MDNAKTNEVWEKKIAHICEDHLAISQVHKVHQHQTSSSSNKESSPKNEIICIKNESPFRINEYSCMHYKMFKDCLDQALQEDATLKYRMNMLHKNYFDMKEGKVNFKKNLWILKQFLNEVEYSN